MLAVLIIILAIFLATGSLCFLVVNELSSLNKFWPNLALFSFASGSLVLAFDLLWKFSTFLWNDLGPTASVVVVIIGLAACVAGAILGYRNRE